MYTPAPARFPTAGHPSCPPLCSRSPFKLSWRFPCVSRRSTVTFPAPLVLFCCPSAGAVSPEVTWFLTALTRRSSCVSPPGGGRSAPPRMSWFCEAWRLGAQPEVQVPVWGPHLQSSLLIAAAESLWRNLQPRLRMPCPPPSLPGPRVVRGRRGGRAVRWLSQILVRIPPHSGSLSLADCDTRRQSAGLRKVLQGLKDFFIRRSFQDSVQHVGDTALPGGDQVCGFLQARPAVVLYYGLKLEPEHGPWCRPVELRWLRRPAPVPVPLPRSARASTSAILASSPHRVVHIRVFVVCSSPCTVRPSSSWRSFLVFPMYSLCPLHRS
jgi:hypothetical protein